MWATKVRYIPYGILDIIALKYGQYWLYFALNPQNATNMNSALS